MSPPSRYRLTLKSGKQTATAGQLDVETPRIASATTNSKETEGIEITDEMIEAGFAELTAGWGLGIRESALRSSQGHRAQASTLRSRSELWLTIFRT